MPSLGNLNWWQNPLQFTEDEGLVDVDKCDGGHRDCAVSIFGHMYSYGKLTLN